MLGKITRVAVLLLLATTFLVAQQASVRRDTQFPVELRTTVKTEHAKVGERVEFRLSEAVLIGHDVVVPRGAKIYGHVTEVWRDAADEPHSRVSLRIDTLKWKHGQAPLNAVIFSVERTPAQEMLMNRRRFPFLHPPTFLENIRIRAHLTRNASTEFFSSKKDFTLHKGLLFMLRQIDPNQPTKMMGKPVVEVGPTED